MLNISKYHKLIVCTAIATTSLSGFVQSASAQLNNGSNQAPIPVIPVTPVNPPNNNNSNIPVVNPVIPVADSNQPTTPVVPVRPPVADSNQPTTPVVPVRPPVADSNQPTTPVIPVADSNQPTTPVIPPIKLPTNDSDNSTVSPVIRVRTVNVADNKNRFNAPLSVAARPVLDKFNAAMAKYASAAAELAAAEAAQTPASATSQPVRYGREARAAADCGCPNADTVGTSGPSPALVAARQAEAAAAAELAAAKAEAREFLDSVKNTTVVGSSTFSPIW